jgi:hypothetical protein
MGIVSKFELSKKLKLMGFWCWQGHRPFRPVLADADDFVPCNKSSAHLGRPVAIPAWPRRQPNWDIRRSYLTTDFLPRAPGGELVHERTA